MGATYNSGIVKTGLMVHLDAGNPKSYPGTGTSWYNLADKVYPNANCAVGDMNAGVTFVAGPPASMQFSSASSGIVDLGIGADFFSPTVATWNNLHEFTVEAWVKSSGMGASQTLGGIWGATYGIRLYFNSSGTVQFAIDNGTTITGNATAGNYLDGNWHHVLGTQKNAGGDIYVDGVKQNGNVLRWQGKTRWSTNNVYLGRDNNNTTYYLNGNIAIARFYRKWLSLSDVRRNFEAERTRFGV